VLAGSSFSTLGRTVVGLGSAFTSATDGFDDGTPGATMQGEVRVQAGGTLRSAHMVVASNGGGNGRTGTEKAIGTLVVEGTGSLLAMTRPSTAVGNASLLSIANGTHATGVVEVRNGGRITLDGSITPTVFTDINIASGGPTSNGKLVVDGPGSLIELSDGQGFIIVGTNVAGSIGELQITGGSRDGATGTLTVSGNDAAGNASTLRLAGRNSETDGGAFLHIGGIYNSGSPGTGTAHVLAGGRIEVDSTVVPTNTLSARPGTCVGFGQGSNGKLNVNSGGVVLSMSLLVATGAGSTGAVNVSGGRIELGGTSPAPGGTGTINVSGGSLLTVSGPSAALRVGGASSATVAGVGTLNLSGAGSGVFLAGTDARALIGAATGTTGTVNIGAGTTLSATSLIGIAHDGTASTGGRGILVVNGVAAAASIVNGAAGVIQGSGTLVGNVINHGTINPGNSPGTLVIDGTFTNAVGGHLVLEVASDGNNGFVTDQLVFTPTATVNLAGLQVEFRFLGAANPTAFQKSGGFDTDAFFRRQDAQGGESALGDTAFGGVQFTASSQAYNISGFSYDVGTGAQFSATPVPEPATWALWMAGALGMAGLARRRRPAA